MTWNARCLSLQQAECLQSERRDAFLLMNFCIVMFRLKLNINWLARSGTSWLCALVYVVWHVNSVFICLVYILAFTVDFWNCLSVHVRNSYACFYTCLRLQWPFPSCFLAFLCSMYTGTFFYHEVSSSSFCDLCGLYTYFYNSLRCVCVLLFFFFVVWIPAFMMTFSSVILVV